MEPEQHSLDIIIYKEKYKEAMQKKKSRLFKNNQTNERTN